MNDYPAGCGDVLHPAATKRTNKQTNSTMETTKSTRIEDFSHYSMASLAAGYEQRLKDAARYLLDWIRQGGEREIMFDRGFWFDPSTARDYRGLRVDGDGRIWAVWNEPDGTELTDTLSALGTLGGYEDYAALKVLGAFAEALTDLAWDNEKDEY